MEKTEQINLIYDKGLTTIPSDMLCTDSELEQCDGLICENGEIRPLPKPVPYIGAGVVGEVLFVHHVSGGDYNIIHQSNDTLKWYCKEKGVSGEVSTIIATNVEAIGNTLIIGTSEGLRYAIWNGDGYTYIEKLPTPKIIFRCYKDDSKDFSKRRYIRHVQSDVSPLTDEELYNLICIYSDEDTAEDTVVGLYEEAQNKVKEENDFYAPFFVRYGLELMDGSYYYISNPILMLPAVRWNLDFGFDDPDSKGFFYLYCRLNACKLQCEFLEDIDFALYDDIIRGIAIFVSPQCTLYDSSSLKLERQETVENAENLYTWIPTGDIEYVCDGVYQDGTTPSEFGIYKSTSPGTQQRNPFYHYSDSEIKEELKNTSTFFKLCVISQGTNSEGWMDLNDYIKRHTVENLTSQEQLPNDDFYSRCPLTADVMKVYNNRLTLANITRGFFDGFTHFVSWTGIFSAVPKYAYAPITRYYYVHIKTSEGDRCVCASTTSTEVLYPNWFFYPDTRAYQLDIATESGLLSSVDLKQHPYLNGAYYIGDLPSEESVTLVTYIGSDLPATNTEYEHLASQIITSEVNNPWVFFAEGYNAVPDGEIIGLASITSAISQGQFGAYPLIIFTDKGIYAMTVATDGYYSGIKPQMSREVCNNTKSITEVDGAIFFCSRKGLMVIMYEGNGSIVKHVSSLFRGKVHTEIYGSADIDLDDFFEECDIAYDYKDNRLLLFTNNITLVYSITNGTFAWLDFVSCEKAINAYPDYFIQTTSDAVYSLLNKPNDDDDTATYSGKMTTRSLKLGNGLSLKGIRQVKHLTSLSSSSILRCRLWGSNDMQTWKELAGIGGAGKKFYKLGYTFENMNAGDRFVATSLLVEHQQSELMH